MAYPCPLGYLQVPVHVSTIIQPAKKDTPTIKQVHTTEIGLETIVLVLTLWKGLNPFIYISVA